MAEIIGGTHAPRPAHASFGEVGLATGAVAAALSIGPTIVPRTARGSTIMAGTAGAVGLLAGVAGEGIARLVDVASPLDRTQAHLAVAAGGLVAAVAGRRFSGNGAAAIASAGAALAATGTIGALMDTAHRRFDHDQDGRFGPDIPTSVTIALVGAAVVGLGAVYGRKALTALKNSGRIAAGGAAADEAGRAAGELIPRSKLGMPGRMFLEGRVTGAPGMTSEPVRTYMPFKLDGRSLQERVSLTVDSMVAQGAFAKSRIVIGSPTGTGAFNPVPVAMDELLSKGDSAWVIAQYGNKPSVQSLTKTDEGIEAFIELTRAIAAKRAELYPGGGGPKLYAAATSLGAHNLHETILKHSDELFGSSIDMQRMLLVGAPEGLTTFTPASLAEGLAVRARSADDIARIATGDTSKLRVLEFAHANDPVRLMDFRMGIRRPEFLTASGAAEGVAHQRRFVPGVTLVQHGFDVTGSIAKSTGPTIGASMHDYRGDMHGAVALALGHDELGTGAVEAAAAIARERASADVIRIRSILAGK